MKLCPQCDFIYEDDQSFCDMDGNQLVHKRGSESRFKLVIPIESPIAPAASAPPSSARRSSGFIVAVLAVVILAALVVLAYFARARRVNAGLASGAPAVESAQQSSPVAVPAQSSDTSPAQPTDLQTADQADKTTNDQAEDPQATKTALAHSRLSAGPVTASVTNADRGFVIVHLTNGATIKADEAWEKREGVWYRQQGLVTFLKRSQVRSIERRSSPSRSEQNNSVAGSNTVTGGSGGSGAVRTARSPRPQPIAQSQPTPKKQSGVTSFLKKTGSFIKKPFHF